MSKSLGNIYTLKDIADKGYSLDAFKLLVLSKHYRTEGNFTWEIIDASQKRLNRFKNFANLRFQTGVHTSNRLGNTYFSDAIGQILGYMYDDLNSPQALAYINEMMDHIDKYAGGVIHEVHQSEFVEFLTFLDSLFGLGLMDTSDITDTQKDLLQQRHFARQDKNWQLSDEIRDRLKNEGITTEDRVFDEFASQVWSKY